MPLFKYQAKNKEGETYSKTIEAADRLALYGIIREEGGTIITIEEAGKSLFSFSFSFSGFLRRIKTEDKINFAKNLGQMIEAGLSVTRALNVMGKQTKNKAFKALLKSLDDDVSHGITLSDALAKRQDIFSKLMVSMVRAGEESGSVSDALRIVGSQMEKSHQLVKKVRGAMIYPIVIVIVMIIITILLLIFMVPTLTATFKGIGVKLPLPTRILIASSDFLIHNTILVLALLMGIFSGGTFFVRSEVGHRILDRVVLKLPVIGEIAREVQSARSTRTLSSLLTAGVEVVSAIGVTSDVLQNHLYKAVLDEARIGIQKGETLSSVFAKHENLYPAFVGEMTSVGEETGKIAHMLESVATYYENEVDQKTKDLSTIIEPLLMIFIGAGVGAFAVSMLAPTYSLVDYI